MSAKFVPGNWSPSPLNYTMGNYDLSLQVCVAMPQVCVSTNNQRATKRSVNLSSLEISIDEWDGVPGHGEEVVAVVRALSPIPEIGFEVEGVPSRMVGVFRGEG